MYYRNFCIKINLYNKINLRHTRMNFADFVLFLCFFSHIFIFFILTRWISLHICKYLSCLSYNIPFNVTKPILLFSYSVFGISSANNLSPLLKKGNVEVESNGLSSKGYIPINNSVGNIGSGID